MEITSTPLAEAQSEEMETLAFSAPPPAAILTDAAASRWLKKALMTALARNPVKALNDALVLAAVLDRHLRDSLGIDADPEQ